MHIYYIFTTHTFWCRGCVPCALLCPAVRLVDIWFAHPWGSSWLEPAAERISKASLICVYTNIHMLYTYMILYMYIYICRFYCDQLPPVGSACIFPTLQIAGLLCRSLDLGTRSIVFGWPTTQTAMMLSRQILYPTKRMSEQSLPSILAIAKLSFKKRCY